MPNDPAVDRLRVAEKHALDACTQNPKRIIDIFDAIRKGADSPNFPDAEMLTAIANLSDAGRIAGRTLDGYYHFGTPDVWAKIDAAAKEIVE